MHTKSIISISYRMVQSVIMPLLCTEVINKRIILAIRNGRVYHVRSRGGTPLEVQTSKYQVTLVRIMSVLLHV